MQSNRDKLTKCLAAILLGNGLYFALSPRLPPAARNGAQSVNLGTAVDFWFCLLVYGLFELASFVVNRRPPTTPPRE